MKRKQKKKKLMYTTQHSVRIGLPILFVFWLIISYYSNILLISSCAQEGQQFCIHSLLNGAVL